MNTEKQMNERIHWLEARVNHLEEEHRQTLTLIDAAMALFEFPDPSSRVKTPEPILDLLLARAPRLIPVASQAVYLTDDQTAEFRPQAVHPAAAGPQLRGDIERLIERGVFHWATCARRAVFAPGADDRPLLLHVLSTNARIRGMYVAQLNHPQESVFGLPLTLLGNLLQHAAHALESVQLYRWNEQLKGSDSLLANRPRP